MTTHVPKISVGLGLDSICRWIPCTTNVMDYYCAMDVFALTSREDPFPLVMLEAGLSNLPVICFADSGGGPEFVNKGAGLVAPYSNAEAFSAQLTTLLENVELRTQFGSEAARQVRNVYSVEKQASKLLCNMEYCLKEQHGNHNC
jgi:glycosyltransferase involved in cell wall biosynthesis